MGRGLWGWGVGWWQAKEPASECASFCQNYPLANYPLATPPNLRNSPNLWIRFFCLLNNLCIVRGRRSTRKHPPKIKKFIRTSFSEQFPLDSWLVSQGSRQKFARTFRKSSHERGVFFGILCDFGRFFGPRNCYAKSPPERVPGEKFLSLPWRMWWSLRKCRGWQILTHISWENTKENLPPKIHRVFHTGGGVKF